MEPLEKQVEELAKKVAQAIDKLDIRTKRRTLDELQGLIAAPDFWNNQKKAAQVSQEASQLLAQIEPWESIASQLKDLSELVSMGDTSMETDLNTQLSILKDRYDKLQGDLKFQGRYDDHGVILSIYAGAGGTDAQDWAQMLLRMYVRWAESHGLKVKTVEQSAGEEAGIKSATVEITGGINLYGKLAGEHGVHRLVRQSPFNSAASRETSFAKVDVLPMIDKPGEVELDEKDLKVDVFRAGGHGGQSVNTTDSAVRVTHLPTGITVAIQNERSQLQNKETALTILRSRLAALQLEQHAASLADVKGPNQSAEFGNQIRNYVLHPYKQVKDTRTGYETSDPQKILDGNLDPLIDAWLEQLSH
jgi:peptide chain release factor 2